MQQSINNKTKKYFCVSTDKAANPVNMMGASKRIMEMFVMQQSLDIKVSMARFSNVAFLMVHYFIVLINEFKKNKQLLRHMT